MEEYKFTDREVNCIQSAFDAPGGFGSKLCLDTLIKKHKLSMPEIEVIQDGLESIIFNAMWHKLDYEFFEDDWLDAKAALDSLLILKQVINRRGK